MRRVFPGFGIRTSTALLCLCAALHWAAAQELTRKGADALPTEARGALATVSQSPLTPYTIGSGDVLNVSVWKEPELSETVTVRPDGKISLPLVGELVVTGLTPVQVETLLHGLFATIVLQPRVTVSIAEIHSRMVFITGEVQRPGAYPLNGPLNVLQLIAQAGGLTEFASRRHIRIIRAATRDKGVPFDYNRVMRGGDPEGDFPLTPGDTVVVP